MTCLWVMHVFGGRTCLSNLWKSSASQKIQLGCHREKTPFVWIKSSIELFRLLLYINCLYIIANGPVSEPDRFKKVWNCSDIVFVRNIDKYMMIMLIKLLYKEILFFEYWHFTRNQSVEIKYNLQSQQPCLRILVLDQQSF